MVINTPDNGIRSEDFTLSETYESSVPNSNLGVAAMYAQSRHLYVESQPDSDIEIQSPSGDLMVFVDEDLIDFPNEETKHAYKEAVSTALGLSEVYADFTDNVINSESLPTPYTPHSILELLVQWIEIAHSEAEPIKMFDRQSLIVSDTDRLFYVDRLSGNESDKNWISWECRDNHLAGNIVICSKEGRSFNIRNVNSMTTALLPFFMAQIGQEYGTVGLANINKDLKDLYEAFPNKEAFKEWLRESGIEVKEKPSRNFTS